jgi:hypothetical protein
VLKIEKILIGTFLLLGAVVGGLLLFDNLYGPYDPLTKRPLQPLVESYRPGTRPFVVTEFDNNKGKHCTVASTETSLAIHCD